MPRNYLTHKIATLYDPPKEKRKRKYEKEVYSQMEAARIMGVPTIFVRLLLDAGRLSIVDVPNGGGLARHVLLDTQEWARARDAWRQCLIQWNKQVSQG